MAIEFKKATRGSAKLRMGLIGPPGSGKTYSALRVASYLRSDARIAVMDTEHDSAKLYAPGPGQVADPSHGTFDFAHLSMDSYSPLTYVDGIEAAEKAGFNILIIDSISHAWTGKDGALEQVERAAKRSQSGNKFAAWGDVTPMQNRMIEAMLGCHMDLIVTLRTKVEYVVEEVDGKKKPRKIGMAPVQRDGMEYEFGVVIDMTTENDALVSKTRCSALSGQVIRKPGPELAAILRSWLEGEADPEFVAAEIAKTTSGKELLRWADTINVFRDAARVTAFVPFAKRWCEVVSLAKNAPTLDAILAAIAGMPAPLRDEVVAAVEGHLAKRRAEFSAESTTETN